MHKTKHGIKNIARSRQTDKQTESLDRSTKKSSTTQLCLQQANQRERERV